MALQTAGASCPHVFLLPLKVHGSHAEGGPGRRCMHCHCKEPPAQENTNLLKELLVNLFIHPYGERHYLYYPDQETNLPSDSEGDIIFITLDYLQGRRKTTLVILENSNPAPSLEQLYKYL